MAVVYGHLDFYPAPLPHAYIGVDYFFALSGFVIAHAYDARFARGLNTWQFLLNRWIRLFPMLFAGTVLGLCVRLMSNEAHLSHAEIYAKALGQLFLYHVPRPADLDVFDLNPPMWSLQYEMVAYALYAFLWSPGRRWLYGLIGIGAVSLALMIAAYGTVNVGVGYYPNPWPGVSRVVFAFFTGVLLRRLWSGAHRRTHLSLLLPVITVLLLMFPGEPGNSFTSDLIGCTVVMPLLIWAATHWEPPRWAVPFLRSLGSISYGVYTLHFPCMLALVLWMNPANGEPANMPPHISVPIMVGAVPIACWLLMHYYDTPVRRQLRAWLGRFLSARGAQGQLAGPASHRPDPT